MANNVYTTMSIESSKAVLKNFVDKIITPEVEQSDWYEKSNIAGNNLYKLIYDNYPAEYSRDWNTENLGAKWCFLHDWLIEDDVIELTFESAWYPPEELFHEIAIGLQSEENSKWKPEAKMKHTKMYQADMLIKMDLNL